MVCELIILSEALWRGNANQYLGVSTPVKINHFSHCDGRIQHSHPAARWPFGLPGIGVT